MVFKDTSQSIKVPLEKKKATEIKLLYKMNSACVQVPVGTLTKPLICVGVMIELEAKEEKTFFHVL